MYKITTTIAYSFLALFIFAQFIPLTSNTAYALGGGGDGVQDRKIVEDQFEKEAESQQADALENLQHQRRSILKADCSKTDAYYSQPLKIACTNDPDGNHYVKILDDGDFNIYSEDFTLDLEGNFITDDILRAGSRLYGYSKVIAEFMKQEERRKEINDRADSLMMTATGPPQRVYNCDDVDNYRFWESNADLQDAAQAICQENAGATSVILTDDGTLIAQRDPGPGFLDFIKGLEKLELQPYRLIEKNSPLASIADETGSVAVKTGFGELVSNAALILGGIAGLLAFVFFSTGAFLYVYGGFIGQAVGESSHIQKGKDLMLNAIIGLILILASYIILSRINVNLLKPNIKFDASRQQTVPGTSGGTQSPNAGTPPPTNTPSTDTNTQSPDAG